MWLAKPLEALSEVEMRQWIHACSWRRRSGEEVPLAQTLTWARAAQAAGGGVHLILSPAENVGGVVLGRKSLEGSKFECINGPLLDWDTKDQIARQVATFAMAASKLAPDFVSLTLRPRWLKGQGHEREKGLPIEADRRDFASTLVLPLQAGFESGFSARLQRTLAGSLEAVRESSFEPVEPEAFLAKELPRFREFGKARGFYVPESTWFRALLERYWISEAEGARFFLSRAELDEGAATVEAAVLVALVAGQAHHLFVREERGAEARGALSAQAVAIHTAMTQCIDLGAREYDFMGYVDPEAGENAYAGVARFKEQFGGAVKEYEIPEFVIA